MDKDWPGRNTPPHVARPWPLPIVPAAQAPCMRVLLDALRNPDSAGSPDSADSPNSADSSNSTDRPDSVDRPESSDSAVSTDQNAVARLVDAFMERVKITGTPVIEPAEDDATRLVTFIYRGPAANRVYLQANKLTDPFVPAEAQLQQLPRTDLATLTLRMPADWICTYSFVIPDQPFDPARRLSTSEVRGRRALAQSDRLNPVTYPNKRNPDAPLSVVALDQAIPEPPLQHLGTWRDRTAGLTLPVSGRNVRTTVRSHARADADSVAILLTDGEDWLADTVHLAVGYLIDHGQMPPAHLVYVPSGGPQARQLDYTAGPQAQARLFASLHTVMGRAQPGWRGQWLPAGQSLGGLFALLAAVRFPNMVAGAVAQSPSLWWPTQPPPHVGAGQWFAELGAAGDCAPCAVQVGGTEWVLQSAAAHARDFLRGLRRFVPTSRDVVMGGHDMVWWRRALPEALALVTRSHLG